MTNKPNNNKNYIKYDKHAESKNSWYQKYIRKVIIFDPTLWKNHSNSQILPISFSAVPLWPEHFKNKKKHNVSVS